MLKKQESSQSTLGMVETGELVLCRVIRLRSFNPVSTFAHAFEQGQSEKPKSPLDVFAGMPRSKTGVDDASQLFGFSDDCEH